MKKKYEEIIDKYDSVHTIKFTDENDKVYWIPIDPNNSDYQRYLRWLNNPQAEESTQMVTDEASTL